MFAGTTFYDRDGNLRFKLMQTTLSEEGSNDLMVDHGNEPVCEQYINGHRGLMIEYAAAPRTVLSRLAGRIIPVFHLRNV